MAVRAGSSFGLRIHLRVALDIARVRHTSMISRGAHDPSRDQRWRGPTRALLLIEQRVLADVVRLAPHHASYITRVASTGQEAMAAVAGWSPHLVVLDMDIEGNEMLQRFATATLEHGQLAIIALTRYADLKLRLTAFERGADDVLTVPFSPEDLVARVMPVMRRTFSRRRRFYSAAAARRSGDRHPERRVRAGGVELHLTSIEQSRLCLLAANAGRVLTRDEILDDLRGRRLRGGTATSSTGISATCASSCNTIHDGRNTCHRA